MSPNNLQRALIVSSLGYFIDVFDIQLFAVLRVPSLTELGVPADHIASAGGTILNFQMAGMLLGAVLWSFIGDRFGRLKALYGSILLYSLGTLACSFVHDVVAYAALRFATGFGLAGETGTAITLIGELMPPGRRVLGIMLISALGSLGPAFAVLVSWFCDWRVTYLIAGLMGLAILILRLRLLEPEIFSRMPTEPGALAGFRTFVRPRQFSIFLRCVLIGLPFAYLWNLLNFFSLELSREVLLPGEAFNQKLCLMLFYFGTSLSGFLFGWVSHKWRSRRIAMMLMLLCGFTISVFYLLAGPVARIPVEVFYGVYLALGLSGSWLLFTMIAAESVGTNIRVSNTVLVTNAVRGFAIPMVLAFRWLDTQMPVAHAALAMGVVIYLAAFLALRFVRETHETDMDYRT